jgi:nickel-dependent lactate racemase
MNEKKEPFMNAELLCGKETVNLTLPDSVTQLDIKPAAALFDPEGAIGKALDNPIESPPLADIAKKKQNACIVISDITRPVPNKIILPPMLKILEDCGIKRENITILIATGMHRPNLGEELESMVGKEIMDSYRIVNHYCRKSEEYREIDKIDGAPIELNIHYLNADLKILTGLIEPHFYAGYSGGRKAILPGISSYETMKFMHSFKVIDQLKGANCNLNGNIFHEYGLKVTALAGVDFLLNVVINKNREITGVFAGHYDKAHMAGCEMVFEHAVTKIDERVDLVITSAGGYPLDATFYQVSKCLTSAKDILKKGGTIVVTCGCQEGLGSEEFCGIMQGMHTPEQFFDHHGKPENFVIDQWCAQNIYQALDQAGKIYVFSPGLSETDLSGFGAVKIEDVQATVDGLLPDHGRAVVVPDGPYVVGKVG